MTHYMPIVPVGLFDVLANSKAHNVFILSQFWDEAEYRQFYQQHKWDNVIIDNALYEDLTPTNFDDMIDMARTIRANRIFVVGPEVLEDGLQTGAMTRKIIDQFGGNANLERNICLMEILHKYPNEMRKQYEMTKGTPNLAYGISIFSYRLGYDRASLLKFVGLDRDSGSPYVHAFGWDNLLELYNMPFFDSVDSSIAVTAAVNGIDLREHYQICRQPGRAGAIDPNTPRTHTLEPGFKFDDALRYRVLENINFLTTIAAYNNPGLRV